MDGFIARVDRQLLGKALNPFFKAQYFKSFTKDNRAVAEAIREAS